MDIQGLDKALALVSGNLTLSEGSLPGTSLQAPLTDYNGGQPLTITDAQKQTSATAVTVTGTAAFLNVPAAPVVAVFTLDAAGNSQASIRFTLIGAQIPSSPWKFSTSFPNLPLLYGPGKVQR